MKKSYRHLGNNGGCAIAVANHNYFFLVINLYNNNNNNNNNNNHFVPECTALNSYETYPTPGFLIINI